jgi:hypothetical protein
MAQKLTPCKAKKTIIAMIEKPSGNNENYIHDALTEAI